MPTQNQRDPTPVVAPSVQETGGQRSHALDQADRAYYLRDANDDHLYTYYMTSQPGIVDVRTAHVTKVARAAVYETFDPSPDGKYVLSVRIHPPYSHQTADNRFPETIEVLSSEGALIRTIADRPFDNSADWMFGGARIGPRQPAWRPDRPSTLVYLEALDDGDPDRETSARDDLLALSAPFRGAPQELFRSKGRMGNFPMRVMWGRNGVFIVEEYGLQSHSRRAWVLNGEHGDTKPKLLWSYDVRDSHGNPGDVVTEASPLAVDGTVSLSQRILQNDNWIFLRRAIASSSGRLPILDRFNLATGIKERILSLKERFQTQYVHRFQGLAFSRRTILRISTVHRRPRRSLNSSLTPQAFTMLPAALDRRLSKASTHMVL